MKERVFKILRELSGAEKITLKSKLQEGLGLDSLKMVTLLLELEEEFGFEFEESDMNPFELKTAKDVVKLVEKYEVEK